MASSVDGRGNLDAPVTKSARRAASRRARWQRAIPAAAIVILLGLAALAGPAQAQIVYTDNNAIWAMNDDGSGKRQLISVTQVPGFLVSAIGRPDVFENGGQTIVFESGHASLGSCGFCVGIYGLTGGSVRRLTTSETLAINRTIVEKNPRVTADNLVAFEVEDDNYTLKTFTHSLDTRSLTDGTESAWKTGSASPAIPTPNPVDASELAWETQASGEYQVHINDRSDSSDESVAFDGEPFKTISWSPDGSELLLGDNNEVGVLDLAAKVIRLLLAEPGVEQARFLGSDHVVFAHGKNIYTVPASCDACTLGDADQLTTDGTSSQPAWTSSATPIPAFGLGSSSSSSSKPSGSSSAVTPPPKPPPTPIVAPVITGLSESATKWRDDSKHGGKIPTETIFTFDLNVPAKVTLTFIQTKPGRRVKGRCVKQTRSNSKHPKCVQKFSIAGMPSWTGHAGLNKIRFHGRVSSSRSLAPGTYLVVLTASVAGAPSSLSKPLSFTIVR
jgi:hypothetical protein